MILRYYSTKAGICQQVFSSGILSHFFFGHSVTFGGFLSCSDVMGPVGADPGPGSSSRRPGGSHGISRRPCLAPHPVPASSPAAAAAECVSKRVSDMCFRNISKYVSKHIDIFETL